MKRGPNGSWTTSTGWIVKKTLENEHDSRRHSWIFEVKNTNEKVLGDKHKLKCLSEIDNKLLGHFNLFEALRTPSLNTSVNLLWLIKAVNKAVFFVPRGHLLFLFRYLYGRRVRMCNTLRGDLPQTNAVVRKIRQPVFGWSWTELGLFTSEQRDLL